ncbi:MAG: hypothetical protein WDA65_05340 [Christensenellales bacterium]
MKNFLRGAGVFTAYSVLITIMLSGTAHAYIDPAAGGYIVQIIAGVVIACGVTIGVFWKKIKLFFRDKKMKRLEKSLAKKADNK